MGQTYSADYLVVVSEMCLAGLAAIDTLGIEVDVVGQAHLARGGKGAFPWVMTREEGGC